jgi:hypothetical protein
MWNRFSKQGTSFCNKAVAHGKGPSSWNRKPALGTGNQFLKLEPVFVTENNLPDFETWHRFSGQNRKPVLVTVNQRFTIGR